MNNLKVISKSEYLPEYSNDKKALFLFQYEIKIKNNGENQVQLISRHWNINDSLGRKKVVDGEGVVGEKPFINPGSNFEYESYCPLETSFGYMKGFYMMKDENGNCFKISIPNLGLISPDQIN